MSVGVSASVSVRASEGAGCGLQKSLGLCEGAQNCFPLIFSSKPTVREEGWPCGGEGPYVFFGMKIPPVPKWKKPIYPSCSVLGRRG